MASKQNAAHTNPTPAVARDVVGRELNVGDKVVYASANLDGTTDLNVAWILGFYMVTLSAAATEFPVAEVTSESSTSTNKDNHCFASELVLVESAK